jgi:predicted metalloprotease
VSLCGGVKTPAKAVSQFLTAVPVGTLVELVLVLGGPEWTEILGINGNDLHWSAALIRVAVKGAEEMRWKGRRGSENVEDRRSVAGPVAAGGGLLGFILILGIMLLGGDPKPAMQQMQQNAPAGGAPADVSPADQERADFVSVVLADTEDVWGQVFQQQVGKPYREPSLIMFRDQVKSACGFQSAATGPFYCPLDSKVYIDLGFFDEMNEKLGAPGDFAQAYVVAHEIGHHVQNLLGRSEEVRNRQARASKEDGNELSVRLELQADFYAGVWAHHAQQNWQILEEGDIEEALRAATAIGDDRLQKQSSGTISPESFTHGTSDQRKRWFIKGLKTGDIKEGNTFEIPYAQL